MINFIIIIINLCQNKNYYSLISDFLNYFFQSKSY